MSYFSDLETKLGPTGMKVAIAIVSVLATHVWNQIRARRISLSWTANFQKITPQENNSFSSKIQVLVDNQPAQNLHSCQITIVNESPRDVDEFDLLVSFQNAFTVQHAVGSLSASGKNLLFSAGFQHTVEIVKGVPEAERLMHPSYNFIMQNREFRLPSLNRGATATFTFLVNAKDTDKSPTVMVTSEKKGVRIVLRPTQPTLGGVRLLECLVWGFLLTPVLVYALGLSAWSSMTIAIVGYLIGVFSGLFGIIGVRVWRFIKNLFG